MNIADNHSNDTTVPEVSIIIVNYETSYYVNRLVDSLEQQDVAAEIIVVDNYSEREDWRNIFSSNVLLIKNDTNVGYGRACNIGVRRARAELICILNPDTVLPKGSLALWLKSYRQLQQVGSKVGLVAPLLVNENGTEQRSTYRFPGPLSYWLYHSLVGGVLKNLRKTYRIPSISCRHRAPRSVPWVMGSAMLIPRKAWETVGGFSDEYFLYAEDMDLCYRLRLAGFDVIQDPRIKIIHTQGNPSAEKRVEAIQRFFAGLETFLCLNYPRWKRSSVRLSIILDLTLRTILVTGGLTALTNAATSMNRARLKAYRQLLAWFVRRLFA